MKLFNRLIKDKRGILSTIVVGFPALIIFDMLWYIMSMVILQYFTAFTAAVTLTPQANLTINAYKAVMAFVAIIINGGLVYWMLASATRREEVTYPQE